MIQAFFIDRDGVINNLVKYKGKYDSPRSPSDIILIPGIISLIKLLNSKKIPVIEITNRPEVAKGKLTKDQSNKIQETIYKLLKNSGAKIDKIYACPHHPKAIVPSLRKECNCRKPKPGLIKKASKELGIDLTKSILLGDKASDIRAGKAAGIKTILFLHAKDSPKKVEEASKQKADYKVRTLTGVLPIAKSFFKI